MKNQIKLDTTIQRIDEKLLSSDLGSEIVMMDIESGDYLGLNEVAASIWKLAEKPIITQEICNALMADFEITLVDCQQKTLDFLHTLHEEGLIQIQ
jgi:hypothetical protein